MQPSARLLFCGALACVSVASALGGGGHGVRRPAAAAAAFARAADAAGGDWVAAYHSGAAAGVDFSLRAGTRLGGAALPAAPRAGGARQLAIPFPVPTGNFFCSYYESTCSQMLSMTSCTPAGSIVNGCGGPGNGTFDNFVASNSSCACSSPYVLGDVSSNRVAELLWDAALGGPSAVTLFQAPGAAVFGNQTDIATTFGYLCFSQLFSMGCPLGKIAILPPGGILNATCRCGGAANFDFADRAIESITDALLINATAWISTQVVAQPCYPGSLNTPNNQLMCNPAGFSLLCSTFLSAINCSAPTNVNNCAQASDTYTVRRGHVSDAARALRVELPHTATPLLSLPASGI